MCLRARVPVYAHKLVFVCVLLMFGCVRLGFEIYSFFRVEFTDTPPPHSRDARLRCTCMQSSTSESLATLQYPVHRTREYCTGSDASKTLVEHQQLLQQISLTYSASASIASNCSAARVRSLQDIRVTYSSLLSIAEKGQGLKGFN